MLSAHLVGDFPLQPDWIAQNKLDDVFPRFVHVVIHAATMKVFLTIGGVAPEAPTLFYLAYAATHFVIDSRRWGEEKEGFEAWQYILDQTFHITSLAFLSVLFL